MVVSLDGPLAGAGGSANPDATLASLAFINVTWEASRASYLDNFVPYALEALRVSGPQTAGNVESFIGDRFGLAFPSNVVESLLARAVRSKKVKRLLPSREYELAPGVEAGLTDLKAKQQEHRREQVHLVRGLVEYASTTFSIAWGEEQAEQALVAYIDHHAVPLLTATQRGTFLSPSDEVNQGAGYVVSRYVASIVEGDPVAFQYLDGMIKGSMLAAVLFVNTSGQVMRRFKHTTLYLDTPVCLRALGHEGEDAKNAARQMLRLALTQGAALACFEHNLREMRGVLEGVKSMLRRTRGAQSAVRGVAAHFKEVEGTPADVDLAIVRLEQDLMDLRIEVRSTPDYTLTYGLDEERLEEVLQKRVRYRDESTRIPDVKSLTAIHRIRQGSSAPHLETCRAVFITNNSSLVRASRDFFDSGKHEWPLAMVDHALSTLLWVKEPTTAPDLPRLQVLADCYAALSPSASLWSRISDEIERLASRGEISDDSIALLRYSHEAEQALMDVTLGDPSRVNEGVIRTALERARAVVAQPAQVEAQQAKQKAEEAESAEAQSRFVAETSTAENERLRERLESLEASDKARQARDNARREAIVSQAQSQADRRARTIKIIGLVLLILGVVGVVCSLVPSLGEALPQWITSSATAIAALLSILGFVALITGGSLFGLVERWRSRAIDKRLHEEELEV